MFLKYKACENHYGSCNVYFDAFYPLTIFCVLFGIYWLKRLSKVLFELENLNKTNWNVYISKIKLK